MALHRFFSFVFLTTAMLAFCCGEVVVSQVIFTNDFEDDSLGNYSRNNLDADWNSPPFSNGVDEGRVSIVNDGDSRVLAVSYPDGLFGSSDSATGGQWILEFEVGYEAVELQYRVKFGAGFDFVRGGKLPGLTGGEGNVGGNRPDGTDGFSARMHWRTNGSSGSQLTGDKANIVQYLYHPDQPTDFGDDRRWDDGPSGEWQEFESGRWYHLRHQIVMNTPGQHDGIVKAWLDGVQVLDLDDIRFRDTDDFQIDAMYFSTFFGGGSSIWATTKDEVAFFDDFQISEIVSTLLGDVDQNGAVNFLDIGPFIGLLSSGLYQVEADINEDGEVNFLDIGPFIGLLSQ